MNEVSIILPTYNRADLLPRAIQSIIDQTYVNWELIVVDDGSTDNTDQLVSNMMKEDNRIRYVRTKQNGGVAKARNYGVAQAKYNLIAFQDSDDVWRPEKLEKQLQGMEVDAGMCYCDYLFHEIDGKTCWQVPSSDIGEIYRSGYMLPQLLVRSMIGTPTMLLRKECFKKVGGFDEQLACVEDYEFSLKIAKEYKISYINEVLVDAYQTRGSVSNNLDAHFATNLFIIEKYGQDARMYGVIDTMEIALLKKAIRRDRWIEVSEKIAQIRKSYEEQERLKLGKEEQESSEKTPKISVILPLYNVEKWIDRCVESLVEQTIGLGMFEIICVDDCSTDRTVEKLLEWEACFPDNVVLVRCKQNARQGTARNIGLSYARGEWIAFVDSDDWVEPDYLERLYTMATVGRYEIVCCGHQRDFSKEKTIFDRTKFSNKGYEVLIPDDESRRSQIIHP